MVVIANISLNDVALVLVHFFQIFLSILKMFLFIYFTKVECSKTAPFSHFYDELWHRLHSGITLGIELTSH